MAEKPLESRDVSVTRDRPTLLMETTTGSPGPLRSTAGHPVPLADSFVFQPPRTTPGMSPTSFRHLKERSLRNVGKPAIPRERSASWGSYSVPMLSGIGPPLSPFRAMSSSMSSAANSPFMPILGGPPTPSMSKAAMEAALTSERVRMKEKESEEQDMSTEELKVVLRRERIRMSRMAGDLAVLRSNAVQSQAEAEVNEEGRINCLLAHLDGLQQEKGRIILELEREEEMLTNTLQKKLNEVKREKALLEQQIEREQRAHIEIKSKVSKQVLLDPVVTVEECQDEGDDEVELENLVARMHPGEN